MDGLELRSLAFCVLTVMRFTIFCVGIGGHVFASDSGLWFRVTLNPPAPKH